VKLIVPGFEALVDVLEDTRKFLNWAHIRFVSLRGMQIAWFGHNEHHFDFTGRSCCTTKATRHMPLLGTPTHSLTGGTKMLAGCKGRKRDFDKLATR
jgi:hypothetical protein